MVNFPTRIPDCDSHSPALLDLLFLTMVFALQRLSFHEEILIMLLSRFPLTCLQNQKEVLLFIVLLMNILVMIGVIFLII